MLTPGLFLQMLSLTVLLLNGCTKDDPEPSNTLPVAQAAANLQVEIGSIVKLDASGSTDPDGDVLSYKWSLLSKPTGSVASIIGAGKEEAEFTLDKAGNYEVELTVNDGTSEAMTTLTITNLTPQLSQINTSTSFSVSDDFAQKGRTIGITGDFFSKDITENKVTIGDIEYAIEVLNVEVNSDYLVVRVPDQALSGDLKVTVGTQSVTWPTPIKMINYPVRAFVEASGHLEEHIRNKAGEYFEIGSRFKPLVNGEVVGLLLRLPTNGNFNVTLWDVATKTALVTKTITASSGSTRSIILATPIKLEKDKLYVVTTNSDRWYNHIDEQDSQGNQFPKTVDNIELLSTAYHAGTNTEFPDEGLPINYITLGTDVIFSADVQ
jgi:hypothetical protein